MLAVILGSPANRNSQIQQMKTNQKRLMTIIIFSMPSVQSNCLKAALGRESDQASSEVIGTVDRCRLSKQPCCNEHKTITVILAD